MTAQALKSDPILTSPEFHAGAPTCGWRAGPLEVDLERRELRVGGARAVLQELPLRLLVLIVERGGRPVSRRELQERLWPGYDWPSFERNLNTAMRKLRQAIGDDARDPKLIGTLRTSGYRWIGPAPQPLPQAANSEAVEGEAGEAGLPAPPRVAGRGRRRWLLFAVAMTMVLLGAARWAAPPLPVVSVPTPVLRAVLQQRLDGLGWAGRVRLDAEGDGDAAVVSGAGIDPAHVPLGGNPEAAEEILVDLAARLPELAAPPMPALTSALNQTYVEATGTLMNLQDGDVARARAAATGLAQVREAAPAHVGAWLAAARAELALAAFGDTPVRHAEQAHDFLRRAVALDPHSARSAAALATFLNWHEWNNAASARWFALARRLAPQDTRVLHGLAWLELAQGHDADALAHIADAAARDPLDPELQANWGWLLYRTGDYAAAQRQCRSAAHLPAAAQSAPWCESAALAMQGQDAAAWERLRTAPPAWLLPHRAELESLPAAQAWVQSQRWAEAWWRSEGRSRFNAAVAAINAGDEELAMRDLSAALAAHEPMLRLAGATPEFARLRSRTDFAELLRRVREPAALADRVRQPLAKVGAPPPNAL